MPTSHALLTAQLSQLVATACQTIEDLFTRAAHRQAAAAMLVLDKNAGSVGIDCIGGLRLEEGKLLVCFRRSRQGVAAAVVPIGALLNIVAQLENKTYRFEEAAPVIEKEK